MRDETGRAEGVDPSSLALERATAVFESVLTVIFHMMKEIEGGNADAAKQTMAKLSDLQRAYLGVKDAEKAFNEKHGTVASGDIDFDAVRDEIGRKLDRLRRARGAE